MPFFIHFILSVFLHKLLLLGKYIILIANVFWLPCHFMTNVYPICCNYRAQFLVSMVMWAMSCRAMALDTGV